MKRILAIAVALCLMCSVAVAESQDYARGRTDASLISMLDSLGIDCRDCYSRMVAGYAFTFNSEKFGDIFADTPVFAKELLEYLCESASETFSSFYVSDDKFSFSVDVYVNSTLAPEYGMYMSVDDDGMKHFVFSKPDMSMESYTK